MGHKMKTEKFKSLAISTFLLALCACSSGTPGIVNYTVDSPSMMWSNSFAPYRNDSGVVDKQADLRIYQIMVESFIDGDPKRDYNTGYGPSSHKGDLKGVIRAIPYIKSLNMNAIWLTPVFESAKEDEEPSMLDATGYYTRNYYKVDRRFGDEETLKELVDTAHANGLYVILDGVFGHFRSDLENTSPTGKKLTMTDKCIGGSISIYPPLKGTLCTDFNDDGSSFEYIKEVGAYYIEKYKIDGWRLDQAYQIPIDRLRDFKKHVEEVSSKVTYKNDKGQNVNPLGYIVGEFWTDNRTMTNYGYGSHDNPALTSNFDFGLRYGLVQALAVEEWGKRNNSAYRIVEGLSYDATTIPSHACPNLMITNHDLVRFADLVQRAGYASSIDERVKLALSYLGFVHSGPITHYYGEEIGQEVPNFDKKVNVMGYKDDHVARDNGKIDNFTPEETDRKNLFSFLMKLRSEHGAISNGKMEILSVKKDLLAVRKTFKGDDTFIYLMSLNPTDTIKVTVAKDLLPSGSPTELVYTDCSEMKKDENGDFVSTIKPLHFQIIQSGKPDKCYTN